MPSKDIPGFSRKMVSRDKPCLGLFSTAFGGKTRLCTTATEYAEARGCIPGWIPIDRKAKQTVENVSAELGLTLPLLPTEPFMSAREALLLATIDDEKTEEIKKLYSTVMRKVRDSTLRLGDVKEVDPIIIDGGTELWDYIGYANLGKREQVKARYWGPSKRDWSELFGAIAHKTVIITFKAQAEWRDDKKTGKFLVDGPPELEYTTTSMIRLAKLPKPTEFAQLYQLDVMQSIDNNALEGQEAVLVDDGISYGNLMAMLGIED